MNIEELEQAVNKNKQSVDFDGLKKELAYLDAQRDTIFKTM